MYASVRVLKTLTRNQRGNLGLSGNGLPHAPGACPKGTNVGVTLPESSLARTERHTKLHNHSETGQS